MPKALKRVLKVLGVIILVAVLVVAAYIVYLLLTYNRIADHEPMKVDNDATTVLVAGKEYKASTYNIGFGAYTPDFTFFMDEGIMVDGTHTVGEHSRAVSKESVIACTEGAISVMKDLDCDFMLFQEVDTDSTRSYQVNQKAMIEQAFPNLGSAFASNFHSAFLAYPIPEMHGIVNAGLLTLSSAHVAEAERRSYPVDDSFPTKFFDLDRCFTVERMPVDNGKELVLINSHMSAYDEGGKIRAQQLALFKGVLAEEYAKGNYVIAGGDWNHALCNSAELYPSQQLVPPWVSLFSESDLPAGFTVVRADNLEDVATCHGEDIPYEKGVTYEVTIDGFFVSDNVEATAHNVDTKYLYSDHNPVTLTFKLK